MKKGNTARHKSALKRAKQNIKKRARNGVIKSSLRTAVKRVRTLAGDNKGAETGDALRVVVPLIDKAVSKGIITRNTASRKISRLTKLFNKVEAAK